MRLPVEIVSELNEINLEIPNILSNVPIWVNLFKMAESALLNWSEIIVLSTTQLKDGVNLPIV